MERSATAHGLGKVLLLLAATWLAGCSGSGSTTSSADDGSGNAPTPVAAEDDGAQPSVDLAASDSVVPAGGSVTLSWISENATSCNASGGWSGVRSTAGSASVGPLSQGTTFTLTCSGDGGNAMAMLSVSTLGAVTLEWDPPTENVDGSPLDDLVGYRIYYGQFSGSYSDELAVPDENSTRHEMSLPSGSYYFAMTSLDVDGNESALSNEVIKIVN